MTKKLTLTNHSEVELIKLAETKREELRTLRFSASGGKNRNVKSARNLRKEVARALTELNGRKTQ